MAARAGPAVATLRPVGTGDTETLLQLLQAAHAAAGRPFIRVIEAQSGVSSSVIRRALTGAGLPRSREALLALAEALHADIEEWGRRWDALEAARQAARKQQTAARLARRLRTPCQVEGCPNRARGPLCSTHQAHKNRYGDPTAGRFSPKTHPATCAADHCDAGSAAGTTRPHEAARRRQRLPREQHPLPVPQIRAQVRVASPAWSAYPRSRPTDSSGSADTATSAPPPPAWSSAGSTPPSTTPPTPTGSPSSPPAPSTPPSASSGSAPNASCPSATPHPPSLAPPLPTRTRQRRHVWVDTAGGARQPGLVIAWRRTATGTWEAQVATAHTHTMLLRRRPPPPRHRRFAGRTAAPKHQTWACGSAYGVPGG